MEPTTLMFLGVIAGGLSLCLFRHPVWGLYTYVLLFYFDPTSRWWAANLPEVRWSLLAVAVTIVGTVIYRTRHDKQTKRPSFFSHAPHVLFLIYVAWMYAQFAWAISPDHPDGVTYFTKYAVVMYLIYLLIDSRERMIGFLLANLTGCFYLGFIAFTSASGGRLDGVGGAGIDDSNSLGMYMAASAVIAGGLYFTIKSRWFLLPVVMMPLFLNTLVQAGSRGAFLALVVGFGAMYFYRPPGITTKLWAYGAAGIVVFGILANDVFLERIASIQEAAKQTKQADTSALSRIYVAKAQFRMATDHPLGAGHKGTIALSNKYIAPEFWSKQGGRSSHNTFLSALVDQGYIGFLLWCTLCWKLYRRCAAVANWARRESDDELSWLAATLFGVICVVWSAGMFAPFLKTEIFIWMIPLICSLWAGSVGQTVADVPEHRNNSSIDRLGKVRSAH